MNVAHAARVARFETIADWNWVEFERRLYGLAVSPSTLRGRLLHPIEFNRGSHYHGSPSKKQCEPDKILMPTYGSIYFSFQSLPVSHGDRGGEVGR